MAVTWPANLRLHYAKIASQSSLASGFAKGPGSAKLFALLFLHTDQKMHHFLFERKELPDSKYLEHKTEKLWVNLTFNIWVFIPYNIFKGLLLVFTWIWLAFFAGHHSHMLLCSPWLIVFGPRPPQCKSPSLTMLYMRDMFLVSDSCSMLNHVKPQLCALVLVCQEAYSTVGACLTSRFHALSASKLANSCVFHQKWFLEMCFFPRLPEGGEGSERIRGIGRQGCR